MFTALLALAFLLGPTEPQPAGLKVELDVPAGTQVTIINGNQQLTTGKVYATGKIDQAVEVTLTVRWTDAAGNESEDEVTVILRPGRVTTLTITIKEAPNPDLLWV